MTRPFLLLLLPAALFAQPYDFSTKLYPVLQNAQCHMCHNDNGVATGTRLQFPPEGAPAEEVRAFGLRLRYLVDERTPEKSQLLQKPTNRVAHTGGVRIKPGSEQEALLREWVVYLATLPEKFEETKQEAKLPVTVRRLTHSQYNHTVRDLIGDQTRPADRFPKEDFVYGFTNQAAGQMISPLQAEAYNRAAERMAQNAFRGGDPRGLVPCKPSGAGDASCRDRFVRQFGGRAFRRPLTAGEAQRYSRLFESEASRTGDFYRGAALVAEVMLQSPHFLFHLQTDWNSRVANRLAYFLWDTMPDEWLFGEAAAGRLSSPGQIRAAVIRMLGDERARAAMDEFLAQWLRFDRLRNAIRDRRLYPEFTAELVAAMTEETRRLFGHLVWGNQNFMEFFTAEYSFLPVSLAQLYGTSPPKEEFQRTPLASGQGRAGILGHGSFLTLTSKPADTSPTERGLFIREHFLCQVVPPPPPGVDTTLPVLTDEKPLGTRERLGVHESNPTCAGCHKLVDPIGFGLEKFDAIGKWRDKETIVIYPTFDEMQRKVKMKPTEHKMAIDPAGFVQGLPDSAFASPQELGRILAANPGCQRCVVKQLFRYAVGRPEGPADQEAITAAVERFGESQFRFQELIISIATSRPFLGEP